MIKKEEHSKILKKKKRNLTITFIILLILFMGYGISIESTPKQREKKIISYLEKKYHSKFKILEMTSSREHFIISGIHCDGATFCPDIKDKGVHDYRYEVLSLSDNITFDVEYVDRRLIDKITEKPTYYSLKHANDKTLNDLNNYITSIIGEHKTEFNTTSISITFDEKFDEICDSNYKQQLEKISTYVKEKALLYKDIDILVYFEYSDNVTIAFGFSEPIVTKYFDSDAERLEFSSNANLETYYGLDEYLNR